MPHTGEFVGGSTHVIKIAGSLAKKGNDVLIISRLFVVNHRAKLKKGGKFLGGYKFAEEIYFLFYRFVLFFLVLYLLKKYRVDVVLDRNSSKGIGVFSGFLFGIPTIVELLDADYSDLSLRLANKIFA